MTTHLAKPEGGTFCNTQAKNVIRITRTPAATECTRCRKAAGLEKYDALKALAEMQSNVKFISPRNES